jgi:hypothetical protein
MKPQPLFAVFGKPGYRSESALCICLFGPLRNPSRNITSIAQAEQENTRLVPHNDQFLDLPFHLIGDMTIMAL